MKNRRDELGRHLVLNALTHPWAISVAAVIVVAAVLTGVTALYALAALVYLGLAGSVLLDGDEARKVGDRRRASELGLDLGKLPANLAERVRRARTERDRVIGALNAGPDAMTQVQSEISALVREIEQLAKAAGPAAAYLRDSSSQHPRLQAKVQAITETLDAAIVQIDEIGAEAVVNALEPHTLAQAHLTERVSDLRAELVDAGKDLQAAYAAGA